MFRSVVTAINFSRLKGQIKRAIPKNNNSSKDKRVLPAPTHLRVGSAYCFPSALPEKTSSCTKPQKS